MIPHDVASRTIDGATPLRAWRAAYAQQENGVRLRKASREKIAHALGIGAERLNF